MKKQKTKISKKKQKIKMTCKCSLRRCSSSSSPLVGGSRRTEGKVQCFFARPLHRSESSYWLLLAQVSVISSCHWLSVESAGRVASQVRFGTWSSQQMACTCSSVPVRNRWRLIWRWIDRLAFGSPPSLC